MYKKGKRIYDLTEGFIKQCSHLTIDNNVAMNAAQLKAHLLLGGNDKPMADILIATSASVNQLPLITFDKDFEIMTKYIGLNLRLLKQ